MSGSSGSSLYTIPVASFAIGVLASLLVAALSAANTIAFLGKGSILQQVTVSGLLRVNVAAYITLLILSAASFVVALILAYRRFGLFAAASGVLGAAFAILGISAAYAFGFNPQTGDFLGAVIIVVLGIAGSGAALRFPRAETAGFFRLSTLQLTSTAVFAGLTAALTSVSAVPSPTGGFTHVGDTAIFIAAFLFGPRVGALSGIIGAVAADFYTGYDRWFVSIPAHGLEGLIAGLASGKGARWQAVFGALGGLLMASTYFFINIFTKGLPPAVISYGRDLFGQAAISIVLAVFVANAARRIIPSLRGSVKGA